MIITEKDLQQFKAYGIPVEDGVKLRTIDSDNVYDIPEATTVSICSDAVYVFSEDDICNFYPTRNLARIGFKVKE